VRPSRLPSVFSDSVRSAKRRHRPAASCNPRGSRNCSTVPLRNRRCGMVFQSAADSTERHRRPTARRPERPAARTPRIPTRSAWSRFGSCNRANRNTSDTDLDWRSWRFFLLVGWMRSHDSGVKQLACRNCAARWFPFSETRKASQIAGKQGLMPSADQETDAVISRSRRGEFFPIRGKLLRRSASLAASNENGIMPCKHRQTWASHGSVVE